MSSNIELVVEKRYRIIKQIGHGTFGVCYEGLDLSTGQKVAIKVEREDCEGESTLRSEIKIYKKLLKESFAGIPALLWSGTVESLGTVMVMDLLGPNLEKVLEESGRKMSEESNLVIAIQLIELLQAFHSQEYIHRDIKPENFLLGTGRDENQIFIIDFGLSERYIDRQTGRHIEFVDNVDVVGTPRYCSINAARGHQQSRRDDLISVAYMLSYFNSGSLPWSFATTMPRILRVKEKTTINELFVGMSDVFPEFLAYCLDLAFDQKPDYCDWIQRFRKQFADFGYDSDSGHNYDQEDYEIDYISDRKMERDFSDYREQHSETDSENTDSYYDLD